MNTATSNPYATPTIDVVESIVEWGYIGSTEYGESGAAGDDIDNNDFGSF